MLRLIRDLALAGNLQATTSAPGGHQSPGPEAAGSLSAALGRLRRVSRPGGLIFIISDFYSMDADTSRHLGQLRRHGEVVACQVSDALELAPPPPGRYGIGDGRRSGILDTGPALARERYADYFARHHAAVAALTAAHGIPLIRLSPEDDPVARLAAGLGLRLGRTRRAPEGPGTGGHGMTSPSGTQVQVPGRGEIPVQIQMPPLGQTAAQGPGGAPRALRPSRCPQPWICATSTRRRTRPCGRRPRAGGSPRA